MELHYKLGKLAATPDRVALRLCDYVQNVPAPPDGDFGHEHSVANWGMMANDRLGCCVWSGAGHETLIWSTEGGRQAIFTDQNIIKAYSAVTGYDPAKDSPTGNPTDNGTNVVDALKYRFQTGLTDALGGVHKIAAYAQIDTDPDKIAQAAWLFSAAGIGIQFPSFAMDQFNAGKPWDLQFTNTGIEGGHYVPIVGRIGDYLICVTWGRLQFITVRFLAEYCDEAYAIFDQEMLVGGKSPEGFPGAVLLSDVAALTGGTIA